MAIVKHGGDGPGDRQLVRWLKSVGFTRMLTRVRQSGVDGLTPVEHVFLAEAFRRAAANADPLWSAPVEQFYRALVEHKFNMPTAETYPNEEA